MLLAAAVILATSCTDPSNPFVDACDLVDLENGSIHVNGLGNARRYYQSLTDATSQVSDPDLAAIADSFATASAALDDADRYTYADDPDFVDAMTAIPANTGELVALCIDGGFIDERFPNGLP